MLGSDFSSDDRPREVGVIKHSLTPSPKPGNGGGMAFLWLLLGEGLAVGALISSVCLNGQAAVSFAVAVVWHRRSQA